MGIEETAVEPEANEVEEIEIEEEDADSLEVEEPSEESEKSESEEDEGEFVVTFGDEETPPQEEEQESPDLVRNLRAEIRERNKRIKELEKEHTKPDEKKTVALGPRPTLESVDYDEDRHNAELDSWYEKKREADKAKEREEQAQREQQEAWNQTLASYGEAKKKIKVSDFDIAEEVVSDTLTETQQGMILQGADNPAMLIYALGKNSKKAKELAAISDPVKFAFAVSKLETQMKPQTRKAPSPEKTITGTGSKAGAEAHLAKLRKEAERTGDMSKVLAYKRQLKQK